MGITRIRGLLAISVAALLLVGCKTDPVQPVVETVGPVSTPRATPDKAKPPERVRPPQIGSGGSTITIYRQGDLGGETLQGVFYFDFDQAIVKRSGHRELDKHAKLLMENRSYRVRLEGHADERGTREYNLALGERRANAIRAYITAQGASRSQIEVISYGEEKPAVRGSGERSWAENRRVKFVYRR
jgi:peptidoglycan-associated lipoprotein